MFERPCKHKKYEKLGIVLVASIQMQGKDVGLSFNREVCICQKCHVLFVPSEEGRIVR